MICWVNTAERREDTRIYNPHGQTQCSMRGRKVVGCWWLVGGVVGSSPRNGRK